MNIRILTFAFLTTALLLSTQARGQLLEPQKQTQTSGTDIRITNAWQAASNSLAAFREGNVAAFVKMTHPRMIESEGGKDRLADMTQRAKAALDEQTNGYDSRVEQPNRIIEGNGIAFTIIPQSVSIRLKAGQQLDRKSFLLGISEDDGRTWKLVDGAVGAPKIRELFPEFPRTTSLPGEQ